MSGTTSKGTSKRTAKAKASRSAANGRRAGKRSSAGKGSGGKRTTGRQGKSAAKQATQPPDHKRRARVPKELPAPPDRLEFAWAKCREHFNGIDVGEQAQRIISSDRYRDTILKACEAIDRETKAPQARAYTTAELESLNLLRRLLGKRSYRETRDWLTSDRGEGARQLLGFDRPRRDYGTKKRVLMKGIPSEATMSRHGERFLEEAREAAWRQFFELGRERNLADIAGDDPDALNFVALDGSAIRIHYKAPIRNPKNGRLVNSGEVTAPEAGYRAATPDGDPDSAGHGFQSVHLLIAGLPMIYDVSRIHESETKSAYESLAAEWEAAISPHLRQNGKLALFDADGGFHSQKLRRLIHELGGIPRIHRRSHAESQKSKSAVAKDRKTIWQIDGYPNWRANGLREIFCVCGNGRTFRRFGRNGNGQAVARVEGTCKSCGPISVTAGDWRPVKAEPARPKRGSLQHRPRHFTRCVHLEDYEQADWSFGNPLTFDDPLASAYGAKRFATIEGFHGTLERRFGLIKGKRWFRRLAQTKLEVTMVYAIVHELAIQGREQAALNGATGPP